MEHNGYELYNLYEIEITLKSDLEIYAFVRLARSEADTIHEAVKNNTMVRRKRCIKEDPQALDSCGDPLCGASFTYIGCVAHLDSNNIKMQVNKHLVIKMLHRMGCNARYLHRIDI